MKRTRALAILAMVLAVAVFAAAYANSLDNAFHFDDSHVIERNLFIRDLANVPRFFTDANTFSSLPVNAVYRPVTSLTFALDYAIAGGLATRTYHVTQLLLFAVLGSGLWVFYRRLFDQAGPAPSNKSTALFAALLFCVHTANSQVGNYISARSELLAALGVVGAFLVYLYAPRVRPYHLYLLPVVVGALAKNHAVTFAPLLLTYKLLIEEQLSLRQILRLREWSRIRHALLASAPAFVTAIALFVFIERMAPAGQNYGGGERLPYLATQAWVWVRYVGLYFVPIGLTADTDLRPFTTLTDPRTFAGIALFAASVAAIWRASSRPLWRPVAFGLAWFWITLAPTSSIVPLAEVTNDHRAFLPYVGLNLALVWFAAVSAQRLIGDASADSRRRLIVVALACGLVVVLATATAQRNKVWRSGETLWADVVRKSPDNGRGLMNYGLVKMRRGDYIEARALFLRARALLPAYSFVETNLGIATNALNDLATAERHFRRAIELDETQPSTHFFFGRFLLNRGRGLEAIEPLRRSVDLSPGQPDARHLLMAVYDARGASSELAALARETLAIAASDPVAQAYAAGRPPFAPAQDSYGGWFALGWSYTQAERHLEAGQAYRAALALDADQVDALSNLGWTLGKLGFFDDAFVPLERAIQLRPNNQLARNNLAWVRAELAKRGPR